MISFYPGPSKVYPQIVDFVREARDLGILSANHRSSVFMQLCEKTVNLFKEKQEIPKDYEVFFVSSATEAWEIIAQSLIGRESLHIYNGAFGQKWAEYTNKLQVSGYKFQVSCFEFGLNHILQCNDFEQLISNETEILCLIHNETSNGTVLPNEIYKNTKALFPDILIALDATSSLGGVKIPFEDIDICFASVQKCLGMPAGMAILICSPKAIEKAKQLNRKNHYNSLLSHHENMQKWQTPYTPNVLGIYLLMRLMETGYSITEISPQIEQQAQHYKVFFENYPQLDLLVEENTVRSKTVITLKGEIETIQSIKEEATNHQIILGNGYGNWKETTIRIANFPAISSVEIAQLIDFFTAIQENI